MVEEVGVVADYDTYLCNDPRCRELHDMKKPPVFCPVGTWLLVRLAIEVVRKVELRAFAPVRRGGWGFVYGNVR